MPYRIVAPVAGLALAVLLSGAPVQAQQRAPIPQVLGESGAWTALIVAANGQRICYAFARPEGSEAAPSNRGDVTLTVTHRPDGRDQVALAPGYALGRAAQSVLTVGSDEFRSYAATQSVAFFPSGEELINAFRRGRDAVARTTPPSGRTEVADTFSLIGFTAAYEAISRACPARPAR